MTKDVGSRGKKASTNMYKRYIFGPNPFFVPRSVPKKLLNQTLLLPAHCRVSGVKPANLLSGSVLVLLWVVPCCAPVRWFLCITGVIFLGVNVLNRLTCSS